jgi:energy-coupling factor transporter ATP-binding protein EcfA2
MILKSIDYKQHVGKEDEWQLENCILSNINLIVGKNATGKSRLLNIINGLGNIFSRFRKIHFRSGNYSVIFFNYNEEFKYELKYENAHVVKESLEINGENKLKRGSDGKGKIFAKEENKNISFQIPNDEVAILAKKDAIQHPFLIDLYNWGDSIRHYYFGTALGKDVLIHRINNSKLEKDLDLKDTNKNMLRILLKGKDEYGETYFDTICRDMEYIGYEIAKIDIDKLSGVISEVPLWGILLKESDLQFRTEQHEISQGMFRAFSLIVQLNYGIFADNVSCTIIDDIGEGLDFERSSKLIKLIIDKSIKYNQQLIMSTNDRFVMNNVPLEYWSVLVRKGNVVKIYSYNNAKHLFDEFKLTGLNNFDLFSSDYLEKEVK